MNGGGAVHPLALSGVRFGQQRGGTSDAVEQKVHLVAAEDCDPTRLVRVDHGRSRSQFDLRGTGAGIAAKPIAERDAKVLGVELAPRMAEIARRNGIDVEIGEFEHWDAAGRSFDRVTSAQAWHWLDMAAATAKAASLLRPGGSLGLIWSGGAHPDDLADALEDLYSTIVPPGTHRLFRGYGANRSTDVRGGLSGVIDAITAAPEFGAASEQWFPWAQRYQRDEWMELLMSYSEYAALEPHLRHRLLDAIGTTIDDYGGSFVVKFETVLIAATRLG
jgi:SAM-dependent methyltransferase